MNTHKQNLNQLHRKLICPICNQHKAKYNIACNRCYNICRLHYKQNYHNISYSEYMQRRNYKEIICPLCNSKKHPLRTTCNRCYSTCADHYILNYHDDMTYNEYIHRGYYRGVQYEM